MKQYPCPLGCEDSDGNQRRFSSRTDQMNHIRMKEDEEHNDLWGRLKPEGEGENSKSKVSDESDAPELSESFEEKYDGDSNESDEVVSFEESSENNKGTDAPEGFRELDTSNPHEKKLAEKGLEYIEEAPSKALADKEVR